MIEEPWAELPFAKRALY